MRFDFTRAGVLEMARLHHVLFTFSSLYYGDPGAAGRARRSKAGTPMTICRAIASSLRGTPGRERLVIAGAAIGRRNRSGVSASERAGMQGHYALAKRLL